jgi:hypothetical protein
LARALRSGKRKLDVEALTHQHRLRTMDALMDHADRIERELAKQIRPWSIATW